MNLPSYCKEDMREYAQGWANRCNEPVYFVHWTGEIIDKVEPMIRYEDRDGNWYTINVTFYYHKEGDPNSWESPDDYYGYTELEYTLTDAEGNVYDCPEDAGLKSLLVDWAVERQIKEGKCDDF